MAPEFLRVWNSFCAFVRWGAVTPSSATDWIASQFWMETPSWRAALVDVFLELAWEREQMTRAPAAGEEPPPDDRD